MSFSHEAGEEDMLQQLRSHLCLPWMSELRREEIQKAIQRFADALATLAGHPTEANLRNMNNVWWEAKRVLRGDQPRMSA